MPRTDIIEDTLADDLLWGVDGKDGMAAFLNIKPSRAYGRGVIPVKKHSHRIITASRSKLRRHFDVGEVA